MLAIFMQKARTIFQQKGFPIELNLNAMRTDPIIGVPSGNSKQIDKFIIKLLEKILTSKYTSYYFILYHIITLF